MFKFLKTSYSKVKSGLQKTRALLHDKILELFSGKIDEEALEKLEQLFYEADLGAATAAHLVELVRKHLRQHPQAEKKELLALIKEELLKEMQPYCALMHEAAPTVILVVGINGSGKTTSVAKLAKQYKDAGKSVLVAACDTFRAAATEQLELWAKKLSLDIVKGAPKSDPSAVAFDAITAAVARKCDVVIIDTAGRLHVKMDLMQELQKMRKAAAKACPGSPHETLIVLDAGLGQNALEQAKIFHTYTPLSGMILTKLDGTAKGGMVVAIQKALKIPVKWIGVGETADDLQPFSADTFINALFGSID